MHLFYQNSNSSTCMNNCFWLENKNQLRTTSAWFLSEYPLHKKPLQSEVKIHWFFHVKLIVVIDYLFKGHLRIKSDEEHYNCTEEQPLYLKYNIYIIIDVIYTHFFGKIGIFTYSKRIDLPEYIKCVAIQLKIDSKILKYWSSSPVFRSHKLRNTETIYQFFLWLQPSNRGFNYRLWQHIRRHFLIFAHKHDVSTSSISKSCKRLKKYGKNLKNTAKIYCENFKTISCKKNRGVQKVTLLQNWVWSVVNTFSRRNHMAWSAWIWRQQRWKSAIFLQPLVFAEPLLQ